MRRLLAAQRDLETTHTLAWGEGRLTGAPGAWGLVAVLLMAGTGCAPEAGEAVPSWDTHRGEVVRDNALRDNALRDNALRDNALRDNALRDNGLGQLGLSSLDFQAWFEAAPEARHAVMTYLVSCAAPEGEVRSYTSPTTGVAYTWQGSMGLAPVWSSGQPMPEVEQQLVSACLAARVNKFGLTVRISLRGVQANGSALPTTWEEERDYQVAEGCFFGNFFQEERVQVGNNGLSLGAYQSTPRVCALPGDNGSAQCESMEYVADCQQHCTLDATGRYYESCSYNGRQYRPLMTWLHPSDVPVCGDGVLHAFEQPGMPGACPADQP